MIKEHEDTVGRNMRWAAALRDGKQSQTFGAATEQSFDGMKAAFLGKSERYRNAVLSAVRWIWLCKILAYSLVFVLAAIFINILQGYSFSGGLPEMFSGGVWKMVSENIWASDIEYRVRNGLYILAVWLAAVVIALVSALLVNHGVKQKTDALMKSSEELRNRARALPEAEFTARLNGLAATRLSAFVAKLDRFRTDPGDSNYAIKFATGKHMREPLPEWATSLQTAVAEVYRSKLETPDVRERTREVLKDRNIESKLPTGQVRLRSEEYGSDMTLKHRLSADTLRVTLSAAGTKS